MIYTPVPPIGSFADSFVKTYFLAQEHQRREEQGKLELELLSKEMKLKEKRAQFEEQKYLQDLKQRALKDKAQQAMLEIFGTPEPDPLQAMLAQTTFRQVPGPDTGGAPYVAGPNPVLQQALAPKPTPSGLAAMPAHMRELIPTLLLGGYGDAALRFAEPYLPKRPDTPEGYTLKSGQHRYDANNRLVASAPSTPAESDESLLQAIETEPRLFPKLPAKTRERLAPGLVQRGVRVDQMEFPEDQQLRALRIASYSAQIATAQRALDGTLTPGEKRKFIVGMREDIVKEPAVKDLQSARGGHSAVMVGAKSKNAQGDLAILNGITRLLDPGSVVRPSEFEAARRAQGLIDQIEVFAQRIAKGEILSDATRGQYVNLANALMNEWQRMAKREVEQVYGRLLQGTGMSLDDVWVDPVQLRTDTPKDAKTSPYEGHPNQKELDRIQKQIDELDAEMEKRQGQSTAPEPAPQSTAPAPAPQSQEITREDPRAEPWRIQRREGRLSDHRLTELYRMGVLHPFLYDELRRMPRGGR